MESGCTDHEFAKGIYMDNKMDKRGGRNDEYWFLAQSLSQESSQTMFIKT